jgi:hypothetical protein
MPAGFSAFCATPAETALDHLLRVQRQAVTRALLQHLVGNGDRLIADALGFGIAPQAVQASHQPGAGLGIVGSHVDIA